MTTLPFPHQQHFSSHNPEFQAKKKDIAALLSNHVQPNAITSMTISDATGRTVSLECTTDDPAHLLDLAIGYLNQ